jgi:hypothetical protein
LDFDLGLSVQSYRKTSVASIQVSDMRAPFSAMLVQCHADGPMREAANDL